MVCKMDPERPTVQSDSQAARGRHRTSTAGKKNATRDVAGICVKASGGSARGRYFAEGRISTGRLLEGGKKAKE